MYRLFDYRKIFEAEETGTPVTPEGTASKKIKELVVNLTDDNLNQLESAIEANGMFEAPIYKATYTDGTTENQGMIYFMVVDPGGQLSPENTTKASELIGVPQNYVFLVEKTENHKLSAALELAGSTTGEMASNFFTRYNTPDQVAVTFVKSEGSAQAPVAETPAPAEEVPAQDQEMIATAMNTGEMIGANPSENRSVMSFDAFISEAKSEGKWMADVMKDIKKSGLRKEVSKKKGEKIKGAKDQLIKIHEVIEKMTKQTSKKSTK